MLNEHWFGFLLIFIRTVCVLVTFPVTSYQGIPHLIKVWLAAVVAYLLFISGSISLPSAANLHTFSIIMAIGSEVAAGLLMGFAVLMVINGFRMAGQFIDIKMGLAAAGIFDPQFGSTTTLISQFYYLFAIMIYLAIYGHHHLFMALGESFSVIPLGQMSWSGAALDLFLQKFGQVWLLAFQVSAPVVATTVITDISLGLISKTVPQLHVFLLGMPAKIFLGLLIVYVTLPYLSVLADESLQRISPFLLSLLEGVL